MEIAVQCECGQKFGLPIDDKLYKQKNYTESFMGKGRCPNQDCNLTVYANAEVHCGIGPDEDSINPKVEWSWIEEGQKIHFNNHLYTVAYKDMGSVQNAEMREIFTRILYLHSHMYGKNIIVEVRKSGFLSLFDPTNSKNTEEEIDMWTSVELIDLKKKKEMLDNVG